MFADRCIDNSHYFVRNKIIYPPVHKFDRSIDHFVIIILVLCKVVFILKELRYVICKLWCKFVLVKIFPSFERVFIACEFPLLEGL